ncbi:hypothetical protein DFH11DRAFT_1506467 [Phellopilus nigrolimitatus]|nr:hypothetical protein DFH11DRAFT_1506467 [Phellopilus nigrolimitatus]
MLSTPQTLFIFWVIILSAFSGSTVGILVNVTIDDENGDSVTGAKPTYSGVGLDGWAQGAGCHGCMAKLDPSQAFDGTWHDSTWHPGDADEKTIEMSFSGTAVYAFFLLANNVSYVTTLTSLSFSVDGNEAGTFVHQPTSSLDFQYNVPGFSKTDLANAPHTLTIQTAGNDATLILFDYVVYTYALSLSHQSARILT